MAKIYRLNAGAKVPGAIQAIAAREKIRTARVEAIGGVSKLTLAYFNHNTKKYEEHDYEEFLEVTSLLGNITLKEGKPFLHAHGNFGKRDQSVVGGHIVSATSFPFLEVVITPTENVALKRFDESMGMNAIYKA